MTANLIGFLAKLRTISTLPEPVLKKGTTCEKEDTSGMAANLKGNMKDDELEDAVCFKEPWRKIRKGGGLGWRTIMKIVNGLVASFIIERTSKKRHQSRDEVLYGIRASGIISMGRMGGTRQLEAKIKAVFGRTRHGPLRRTRHGVVGRRKHRPFRRRKHRPFEKRRGAWQESLAWGAWEAHDVWEEKAWAVWEDKT
ncbi:hypothetical protein Tco_1330295 [Tanacetum coccineum]